MKIELIPIIELPTFKYPDLESISDAKNKSRVLIERNYSEVHNLNPTSGLQYKLTEINDADLKKAIKLHTSDLPIEESCSLFGGYALKIDNEIVLHPQCCGLLNEINDWRKILDNKFKHFYLSECHPSPKFQLDGDFVTIECYDENEEFIPMTKRIITVEYKLLRKAIENLLNDLNDISNRFDSYKSEFNNAELSEILIWKE